MQLSDYGLLYLHAPKTAGNSIQSLLLPHSSDRLHLSGHQDGVDRFEVRGPSTLQKHATLADYAELLPTEWTSYRVALSVRHPFDRALSYYFSPHRWYRTNSLNTFELMESQWDTREFEICLTEMRHMVDFICVDGELHRPEFLLRYESLEDDFTKLAQSVGLPLDARLPVRNRSTDKKGARDAIRRDAKLREFVEDQFADDMGFFGY